MLVLYVILAALNVPVQVLLHALLKIFNCKELGVLLIALSVFQLKAVNLQHAQQRLVVGTSLLILLLILHLYLYCNVLQDVKLAQMNAKVNIIIYIFIK